MDNQPALDDAIDVALDRTLDAQTELNETLASELGTPQPALADRVVHRAEDLQVLTDEATEEAGANNQDTDR
ncbi:MAG: hypothetical protein H0U52_02910 [Chloroflexi bacterium]|nr:hypothetical protein [Chloroflexota bacterium]